MRRRSFLTALGAAGLGGLSGCAASGGTRTLPTPLPERGRPMQLGDQLELGGRTVAVTGVDVRSAIRFRTADGLLDAYDPPERSVVLVRVLVSGLAPDTTGVGARPAREAFTVDAAGTAYRPVSTLADRPLTAVQYRGPGGGYEPYRADAEGATQQFLAYELPAGLSVDEPVVVWTPETDASPARWKLGRERARALASPAPSFSLLSFDVPDRAAGDGETTGIVVVENTGPEEGRFLAGLNYSGGRTGAEDLALSVPADETASRSVDIATSVTDPVTVELAWQGEHRVATVAPP